MKNVNETLKERLEYKRNELQRRQRNFVDLCNNEILTDCFERNAIADLSVMQQLKSEISELEHCLLLYSWNDKNKES